VKNRPSTAPPEMDSSAMLFGLERRTKNEVSKAPLQCHELGVQRNGIAATSTADLGDVLTAGEELSVPCTRAGPSQHILKRRRVTAAGIDDSFEVVQHRRIPEERRGTHDNVTEASQVVSKGTSVVEESRQKLDASDKQLRVRNVIDARHVDRLRVKSVGNSDFVGFGKKVVDSLNVARRASFRSRVQPPKGDVKGGHLLKGNQIF